ncbi:MAG: hypothetical protein JNN00_09815 [Chitinophagaceae bacterium]|nr:hypothetical protein [Chitinophagaceae bacterium]
MHKTILFMLISMLSSCYNNFHSPSEKEIEQAVTAMYEERNRADGGGGWKISEVKVISTRKGDDERHYQAKVTVKGVHTSPPLANRRPDEEIAETREIQLIWRDGGWIAVDE